MFLTCEEIAKAFGQRRITVVFSYTHTRAPGVRARRARMGSYDLPQKVLGVGNANKEPTREPGHFCSVCAWGGENTWFPCHPGEQMGQ